MNVSGNITHLLSYFIAIALSLLFALPSMAQSSENQQIVFEGSLTDTGGNPFDLSGEALVFYISANGCYLYGETTTVAGDSQGNINHRIGSSSLVPGSPNGFTQNLFFGFVSGTTTFAGNDCSVTPSDTRLAQVYYGAESITASIKLGTVPYAHNATMLNGKVAADFIEASNDSVQLFYGGSNGQILTKTVSGLAWVNPSASSVTSSNNLSDLTSATAARTNLGLGSLATKNSVNLATAEVTGILSTSSLPSFSGDVVTAAGSSTTTLQKIRGIALSATAPVSGQVLSYDGLSWGPASITGALQSVNNLADVASATVVRANLGLGSLATKSSLNLNSTDVTGVLPTSNGGSKWTTHANGIYNVSNTAIGTTAVASSIKLYVEANSLGQSGYFKNTNSSGYGLRVDVAGTSSSEYALNVNANSNSLFMIQNDGRIGIGTMAPGARVHFPAGTSTVAPIKLTSGALVATTVGGAIEYDGSRLYLTNEASLRQTIPMGNNANSIDNITHFNSPADINLVPNSSANAVRITGRFVVSSTANTELARFESTNDQYMTFVKGGGEVAYFGLGSAGFMGQNTMTDAMVLKAVNGVQLGTGTGAHLTVIPSGQVGIGTNAPTTALTVSGVIRTTASIEYPDGTTQSSAPFSSYERVSINCGSAATCSVTCPAPKKVISGGCSNSGTAPLATSTASSDTQYYCAYQSGVMTSVTAYAICVKF